MLQFTRSLQFIWLVVGLVAVVLVFLALALRSGSVPCSDTIPKNVEESAQASSGIIVPKHIIEQYKIYIGDLESIGLRYESTKTFYLAIVSALIGLLSFRGANRTMEDYFSPAFIVVFLFIAIVCYLWWDTLQYYRGLFVEKFDMLRWIEQQGRMLPVFT